MSRLKKLYILLGVLAVVCAATFAVLRLEERKEQIRTSEDIILELPPDSVHSLSWEHEGTVLTFHREETWLYDGDEAFPVSEEKMDSLLEQFEAFGVSFIIEDAEDLGQYGLDDPVCTIDLSTEEQSYQILLGDYSKMDSKRYVSIGDGNVYLVQNDPLEKFDTDLRSMIDNDEAPSFQSVSEIRFSGDENYTVIYAEDGSGNYNAEDVYFAQRSGTNLPLDTSKVDGYLRAIRSLLPAEYVSYNVTDEELRAYGLDAPDLTVAVDYTEENEEGEETADTFVLHISRDPEEKKAAEESAGQEDGGSADETVTAYVRVGESPIIYKISKSSYEKLAAAAYDDLRHSEVFWADFADVLQIDVSLEGNSYTITSEKDGDSRIYRYQDEEIGIDSFQDALEGLNADSFTDQQPAQKEEIGLTLYLDSEDFPEVTIKLYRYDGAYCLAETDGKPVSLVDRAAVVALIEAVHAIVLG